ncbi:MAG: AarF/ABC1/UbiB kinase family protein [Nitrospiraceae bacterium]|nr:AarF/ABC1/UbiB kinase family protein [Nitrospiraceae bacterium]
MSSRRYRGRFFQGLFLFLRVLVSYKLLGLRNLFSLPDRREERLKQLHRKNARMLREKMIEQRGVFIKIGQFLSSRVDILPEEYTAELSKLQDQVPPAPFSEIRKRLVEELGPIESVFSSFTEVPIASASLGQAHRACLKDGDCIVVKVQYPGIDEVIAADMRTVKVIMRILRFLYSRVNLDVIYSEFSRIVMEELDYLKEGRNAETFGRNLASDSRIKIPIVYWPYTTSKVLTLEYLEGIKITDVEEIDRQLIDRKEVSRLLAGAYARMFFIDGFFHGDPHPGNIFVRPGPELIFVDFGMVDRISAPKKEGLRKAFISIVDRDSLGLVRALVDMGFIPLTKDIRPLVAFVDRLLQKYRDMSLTEFKAMDIDEIGDDILGALQLSPSIQIPNDFILFGRVIGMLNGLGSRLDPETNLIEIAAPFAKKFIRSEQFSPAGFVKHASATARSIARLPKMLEELLVATSRGETRVEITSADIVRELSYVGRIGRGFIHAILATGAGSAALILYLNNHPTGAAWSAGAAAAMVVWLFVDLRRK